MSNGENKVDFKPLSFFKELFLKEDELVEYYNNKRKYEFENGTILKGMKFRDMLHPILLKIIGLNRKYIEKQTLTIVNDKRKTEKKPVIYAITHIGMYDYQIVCEAIKDHQYPFAGDPETMYRSADGLILALNGLIYCDTNSKEDRYIATQTAKELLNRGGNLAIYPEGVWNLSPNLLSLPLFPGIINIAIETGCDIIPVAVEQYEKDFFVNIGENISVDQNKIFTTDDDKKEYVNQKKDELRDIFATLKWEIMEQVPAAKRQDYGPYNEEYEKFVNTRLREWINPKTKEPYYNQQIVKERTFKIKNVCVFEEAFSHLKKLKLSKNNAFLFRNILNLPTNIMEEMNTELKKNEIKVR